MQCIYKVSAGYVLWHARVTFLFLFSVLVGSIFRHGKLYNGASAENKRFVCDSFS